MAFRPKKQQPNFEALKSGLSQIKREDNALYQVIFQLIDKLNQFQIITADDIINIDNSINKAISDIKAATKHTYITVENESVPLPHSRQLIAGARVSFDTSIPNELIINVTGITPPPDGYWTPLTDGDPDETELIFANGESIAVWVPI